MRPVRATVALIGVLGVTLAISASGAAASPQPAKQSVAQCDAVSNARVMLAGRTGRIRMT
jgi:hypothetical protein